MKFAIGTLFTIYISYMLNWYLSPGSIISVSTVKSILFTLSMILFVMPKISALDTNLINFLKHTILNIGIVYMICNLMLFLYSVLFYFGFSNTVVCALMILVTMIIKPVSTDSLAGKYISYAYDKFLLIVTYVVGIIAYAAMQYVFPLCKKIYADFVIWNDALSLNTRTTMVKNKLSEKYESVKKALIEIVIGRVFAVQNSNRMFDPNAFKNISDSNNIDMSFLKNTTLTSKAVEIDDDLDDLDDLDCSDESPDECLDKCLEEFEKMEKSSSTKESSRVTPEDLKAKTTEENKVNYKKKLAEKRSLRMRGHAPPKKHMAVPTNQQQSMQNMMQTLLQKNNLEAMMKEFPPDQFGNPTIDPIKLKKMMDEMSKK